MHTDDRHTAVVAALTSCAASRLTWWLTEQLNDFVADRDVVRGDQPSRGGVSPAARPHQQR